MLLAFIIQQAELLLLLLSNASATIRFIYRCSANPCVNAGLLSKASWSLLQRRTYGEMQAWSLLQRRTASCAHTALTQRARRSHCSQAIVLKATRALTQSTRQALSLLRHVIVISCSCWAGLVLPFAYAGRWYSRHPVSRDVQYRPQRRLDAPRPRQKNSAIDSRESSICRGHQGADH